MNPSTSRRTWSWRSVALRSGGVIGGATVFMIAVAAPSDGVFDFMLCGGLVMVGLCLISASIEL